MVPACGGDAERRPNSGDIIPATIYIDSHNRVTLPTLPQADTPQIMLPLSALRGDNASGILPFQEGNMFITFP